MKAFLLETEFKLCWTSVTKNHDWLYQDGTQADCRYFASILRSCKTANTLLDGKFIHCCIIRQGFEKQNFLQYLLVQMYCKCGSLEDARSLFAIMYQCHALPWNLMIGALVRHGQGNESLQFFKEMQRQDVTPNKVTFVSILSACANRTAFTEGQLLHMHIEMTEYGSDLTVGTALVNMYGKCGSLEDACRMFEKMPVRDVISWTVMVTTYVQHGQNKLVNELFDHMQQNGIQPNKVTIISILSACASRAALDVGKGIHSYISDKGLQSDVIVGNALINMYGKCGNSDLARNVFDNMLEWDMISWNALIGAYAQKGQGKEAFQIFHRMQQEGLLADEVTFVSVLDACANQAAVAEGNWIHCCIVGKILNSNVILGNALVTLHGKCGNLEEAYRVFDEIHERSDVSWNAMMAAFTNNGQDKEALCIYGRMLQEGTLPNKVTVVNIFSACVNEAALAQGKQVHASITGSEFELDVIVGTAMVNMYGKLRYLKDARLVFDRMSERNVVSWTTMIAAYAQSGNDKEAFALFDLLVDKQDVVVWNALLGAYTHNRQGKEALDLFHRMLHEGVIPDKVTFISSLDAVTSQAALVKGKQMHSRIAGSIYGSDDAVRNALINMYGKCGSLREAQRLFVKTPNQDVVSWSSIIAAYSRNGQGKVALQFFDQMQQEGVVPDEVTFVNILFACSHAGLVQEGCCFFASMKQDYGIVPKVDHYNCMVDLLCRSGHLDAAETLIYNMPFLPTAVSWMSLLFASRNYVDVGHGERAANSIFELDPENATPYVMLAMIYHAAGLQKDAENLLERMRERGLKKMDNCLIRFKEQGMALL